MSLRVCSEPGCPNLTNAGRCASCSRTYRRDVDKRRPSAAARGYTSVGHRRFRRAVLKRDPVCVVCRQVPSEHADHYPRGRDELVRLGLDPDDPQHGRGLCRRCHSTETARHQPGGWNQR